MNLGENMGVSFFMIMHVVAFVVCVVLEFDVLANIAVQKIVLLNDNGNLPKQD